MGGFHFGFARPSDRKAIQTLLRGAGLPFSDIGEHLKDALVARRAGRIVGCVALELYGPDALIRSLTVQSGHRRRGLGTALYQHIAAHAHASGGDRLFLLTTTAQRFFRRLGYASVDRRSVPAAVRSSREFAGLCPLTAVCMTRRITGEIRYFPKAALRLYPDVPGSRMWAVNLKKAMMTYFEVGPHRRFSAHRHASEQITLVLEGELFFAIGKRKTVCLRPGDAIAVPSNIPHAVFTRSRPARAVDAWSPVMAKYRR